MKNIVFINGAKLSKYAFMPLGGGKSSFRRTVERVSNYPDAEKIIIFTRKESQAQIAAVAEEIEVPLPLEIETADADYASSLFKCFVSGSEGFDNIFYVYGDCPFLSLSAAERIYKKHISYYAEYSFYDGGAYGIAPEIISCGIAEALFILAEKNSIPMERGAVFSAIQKDINSFDIETDISEEDIRYLRLSLTADTKRNFIMLENLLSHDAVSESDIFKTASRYSSLIRTLPAYFLIELGDSCPLSCSYCPYPMMMKKSSEKASFMPFEKVKDIIKKIKDFADDAVISLSLWGEPSLHPDIGEIAEEILSYPGLSLVIETSGLGWNDAALKKIKEADAGEGRVVWIAGLDTLDEALYEKLRGKGFREALGFIKELEKLFPGKVFVQAVRMNASEEHLEGFFHGIKDMGLIPLIQKYDSFCGVLKDEKVIDISPLKRIPCWHIKRDFHIRMDGSVPLCREDIYGKYILGNVFSDPMEEIWNRGKDFYNRDLKEEYNELCGKCDEYYTYNF